MILEIATLDIKPGETEAFEAAFAQAQAIIASRKGYLGHELHRCIETETRYALLVRWETLEDHTEGFRNSPEFQEYRELVHPFSNSPTRVEHYNQIIPAKQA